MAVGSHGVDHEVGPHPHQPAKLGHLGRAGHHSGGRKAEIEVENEHEHHRLHARQASYRQEVALKGLADGHATVEGLGIAEAPHAAQQGRHAGQPARVGAVFLPHALKQRRFEVGHGAHPGKQFAGGHVQLEGQVDHRAAVGRLQPHGIAQVKLQ